MTVSDFWKDAKIIKRVIPLRNPPLQSCTGAKSPKYFKHSLSLFLSLFIGAVSGNRENVLEYIYANFPQLESQELRSIGICEKPDGKQVVPS